MTLTDEPGTTTGTAAAPTATTTPTTGASAAAPPASPSPSRLRHAVLGAGGVGLSLAGDLARAGQRVSLLMRPESLGAYQGVVRVSSAGQGRFEVPVPGSARLTTSVDVVWIAVKQPHLAAALPLLRSAAARGATVVPLLNGLDHLPPLEREFGSQVVAGAIRVEARRTGVGEVVRDSLFTEVELARRNGPRGGLDVLSSVLKTAGIRSVVCADPDGVLWRKVVLLAPLALATLAESGPLGYVRMAAGTHALMLACARELVTVAATCGVTAVDAERVVRVLETLPDRTCPSLQRDPAELDAIGGSVLRAAERSGVPVPATRALVGLASGVGRRTLTSVGSAGSGGA